jgi:spore germination cell wall hydrolase CwlJ-like protein
MPAASGCITAVVRAAIAATILLLGFVAPPAATAAPAKRELRCLAAAIYFEARGESERGQRAIAEVVIARTKSGGHPGTICGVVYEGAHKRHCQFSFACDGRSDVARDALCWQRARRIAAGAMASDRALVHGATYFHIKTIHPSWAVHMIRVARIGAHVFYKPRRTAAL